MLASFPGQKKRRRRKGLVSAVFTSTYIISMEFHDNCLLLIYFCTVVMLKLILCTTLSVDLLAAYGM